MAEYTPNDDEVRAVYALAGVGEAFDRWRAARDEAVRQELRERIAQDIRDDLTVRPLAGHDGIRDAALIAEGKYVPPAALRAVLDLHARRPYDAIRDGVAFGQTDYPDLCRECRAPYPCKTIAALEDA